MHRKVLFLCSSYRDAHTVTFPLDIFLGSTVIGVDKACYIIWWPFMNKVQIKELFLNEKGE